MIKPCFQNVVLCSHPSIHRKSISSHSPSYSYEVVFLFPSSHSCSMNASNQHLWSHQGHLGEWEVQNGTLNAAKHCDCKGGIEQEKEWPNCALGKTGRLTSIALTERDIEPAQSDQYPPANVFCCVNGSLRSQKTIAISSYLVEWISK